MQHWRELEDTPTFKYGKEIEQKAQIAIQLLHKVTVILEQTKLNYKEVLFDFQTSDHITYEVKADRRSAETGNFFIECDGYGKPSGINITTANRHMITYKSDFYMVETSRIKQLIHKNTYRKTKTQDKYGMTYGTLLPVRDIEPFATIFPINN